MQKVYKIFSYSIVISIILLASYIIFSQMKNHHDTRVYIYLDNQLESLKNVKTKELQINNINVIIDGKKFEGRNIVNSDNTKIILIDNPIKAGFLYSPSSNTKCYKLYGEIYLQGFLSNSRNICNLK